MQYTVNGKTRCLKILEKLLCESWGKWAKAKQNLDAYRKKVLELKNKNTTTDKAKQIDYLACLPFFLHRKKKIDTILLI